MEESGDRRHVDMELGKLQSEIHAVHQRVDSVEGWVKTISEDIKTLTRPQPKYPLVLASISLTAIILSIMTLAIAPMGTKLSTLENRLHEHDDGHPGAVRQLINRVEKELSGRMQIFDAIHSDEHDEQEADIGELRIRDDGFAERINVTENRITALEAALKQLAGKVVGRTTQGFHWREYEYLVKAELDRLDREVRELRTQHLGANHAK